MPPERHGASDVYRPDTARHPRGLNRTEQYGYQRPPPPPPQRHSGDSYRPNGPSDGPSDMFRFRGQASREANGHAQEFDFNVPGPRFEQPAQRGESIRRPRSPPRGPKRDVGRQGKREPRRDRYASRGGFQKRGPSERNILRSQRQLTPERLEGMDNGAASFKALDDLSDSEAEMELSDDDASAADDYDRASKRVRTANQASKDDVPKWSNPDPYTSLPPPDDSQTKKKDVVKLIRKAKVVAQENEASQNSAAANADFISFNFDEDTKDGSSISDSPRSSPDASDRRNNAQSKFSHLDNLHPNRLPPKPRDLADRIQRPEDGARTAFVIPPPAPKHGLPSGGRFAGLHEVSLDSWPPQNAQAAIQGSKRRIDLGDDGPPGTSTNSETDPPRGKKRKRGVADGSIMEDWQSLPGQRDTPWCKDDYAATESMGLWLHKEIRDFYDYIRPYSFEEACRDELITRIENALGSRFSDGRLYCFGSFASGVYLPTADLDLVFVSGNFLRGGIPVYGASKKWMYNALGALTRAGVAKPGGQVIWGAKVPILKITDPVSNLKVDISFENMTGVDANQTFQHWKRDFPAMPVLVTVIKQFLIMRGLNEVFSGGIGGFTVTCLIISLLQHLPAVQSGDMIPEQHLGEILMDFFDLYGNKFNFKATAISMSPPGYLPKTADSKPNRLCIWDPNRPDNDISGGSAKVDLVFQTFRDAYKALQARMVLLEKRSIAERRDASVLGAILAGNYQAYRQQRDHLHRLYDR